MKSPTFYVSSNFQDTDIRVSKDVENTKHHHQGPWEIQLSIKTLENVLWNFIILVTFAVIGEVQRVNFRLQFLIDPSSLSVQI